MEKKRLAKLEDSKEKEKEPENFLPTSFENDPGSCNSGFYELKAVITHKGRASNSGHYIAWYVRLFKLLNFNYCLGFELRAVFGLVATMTQLLRLPRRMFSSCLEAAMLTW